MDTVQNYDSLTYFVEVSLWFRGISHIVRRQSLFGRPLNLKAAIFERCLHLNFTQCCPHTFTLVPYLDSSTVDVHLYVTFLDELPAICWCGFLNSSRRSTQGWSLQKVSSTGSPQTGYSSSNKIMHCKIWGFHGCDYEECRLLGRCVVRLL
jgi:hypothetical protein